MPAATLTPKVFKDPGDFLRLDIVEDDHDSGRMRVRGTFQRADTKNANGRIYTSSLWEKTLQDPQLHEALKGRRMLGEVEHPKDGVTNLNRVSHIVTDLERKGNEIVGEAEILNTPSGRVIQELFRAGSEVGISSRGRGTSQLRGGVEYVDETTFRLDTFDFVFKPSTPGAYPKLQESVLGNSPYGRESTMEERLTELRRLEVRALDILENVGKTDLIEATSWYDECVEIAASADSIISGLDESETEEHNEEIERITTKISEARASMTQCLDTLHENSDLDRRAVLASAGIVESSDSDDDSTDDTTPDQTQPQNEQQVVRLQDLLSEALAARDHFRTRLAETVEILEADEDELRQRYMAAKRLGEELLGRLKEAQDNLEDISQDYQALEERYQAAKALVAGVAERQDQGRLLRRVREAIEMHPELEDFTQELRACESVEELEEQLGILCKALDLPTQDKNEAMESTVCLAGVLTDEADDADDADWGTRTGEDSDLPPAGGALNESADAPVLNATGALLEHDDRGVASVHRVVAKRPGWK